MQGNWSPNLLNLQISRFMAKCVVEAEKSFEIELFITSWNGNVSNHIKIHLYSLRGYFSSLLNYPKSVITWLAPNLTLNSTSWQPLASPIRRNEYWQKQLPSDRLRGRNRHVVNNYLDTAVHLDWNHSLIILANFSPQGHPLELKSI